MEIPALRNLGMIDLGYLLARALGKLGGCYLGSHILHVEKKLKRYLGLGLIPRAGVALGMALYVKSYLPQVGDIILPVIIGSTVIYELIGPLCTKFVLLRAGEIRKNNL